MITPTEHIALPDVMAFRGRSCGAKCLSLWKSHTKQNIEADGSDVERRSEFRFRRIRPRRSYTARLIEPGAVFSWSERQAGIRRWTDNRKWSPSRVSGAFLVYSELPSEGQEVDPNQVLWKQSFSATTSDGVKMHLIAYYNRETLESGKLPTVSADPRLANITIDQETYPNRRDLSALKAADDAAGVSGSTSPAPNRYPGMRLDARRNARVPELPAQVPLQAVSEPRSLPPMSSTTAQSEAMSTSLTPATELLRRSTVMPTLGVTNDAQPPSSSLSSPPWSGGHRRLPSLRSVVATPTQQSPFSPSPMSRSWPDTLGSFGSHASISEPSAPLFRSQSQTRGSQPPLWRSADDQAQLDSFRINLHG